MSEAHVEVKIPEREKVSYSSLGMHRNCPQKWHYARMDNIERIPQVGDAKVELEFGSWWHALRAADAIARGREKGTLRKAPKEVTSTDHGPRWDSDSITMSDVLLDSHDYWKSLPIEHKDEWVHRLGEPLPNRLSNLNTRWGDEWYEETLTEEPVAVEMGWGRDLPALAGEEPYARLVGYVDEVYRDTKRNLLVIRDHKTAKSLAASSALDDMMDSQLQLYAWGVAPEVASWGVGKIAATGYDRVRSKAPATPWITKAGALSKTVTDFDLHTYSRGIGIAHGGKDPTPIRFTPDPATVQHLASQAARSAWFQRTLVPLNTNVIKSHLRAAMDTATAMATTRMQVAASGEAPRNLGFGCKWCDFVGLCRAQMMGGPDGEYDLEAFGLRVRPGEGGK